MSGADAAACDEDPNTAGNQIVGNSLNCNFGTLLVGANTHGEHLGDDDDRPVRHEVEHGDGDSRR